MKATAIVTVRLERPDGTVVEATRSRTVTEGDNPRFDVFTSGRVVSMAKREVLEMIRAGREDQTL